MSVRGWRIDADEAVRRVEEWLRVSGLDTLGVERDKVVRTPEGWSVPYNSLTHIDGSNPLAELFPAPALIVREPDGQLRQAPPMPDMVSTPAAVPGERRLLELLDPEFEESGLQYLGVPPQAVVGWRDPETDEQIPNSGYRPGGLRKGMRRPREPLEWVLVFRNANWLDDRQFLVALTQLDGYVPQPARGVVYASTLAMGVDGGDTRWVKVSLSTYAQNVSADSRVTLRGAQRTEHFRAGDLAEVLRDFPRVFAPVWEEHTRFDQSEQLAAELRLLAGELGVQPMEHGPEGAVGAAFKNGWELHDDQVRAIARAGLWSRAASENNHPLPADPTAEGFRTGYDDDGRPLPVLDTYGKFHPNHNYGWRYSYPKVLGAYLGFALGEASARANNGGRWSAPDQFRIGPHTRRLLALTDGLIRLAHDHPNPGGLAAAARAGLTADDGWLPRVLGPVPALVDPGAAGLVSALPLALLEGGPHSRPEGGLFTAVPALAAPEDAQATHHLARVFAEMLRKQPLDNRLWLLLPELDLRDLDLRLPDYRCSGVPDMPHPARLASARDAMTTLRLALAAASGHEHLPEWTYRRAIQHEGNRPLVSAIAGAVLGSHIEAPGLRYLDRLPQRHIIETLVEDAFAHFNHASPKNRPGHWDRRYPPVRVEER
ncbi:YrhB domain-containing protein [Actinokineospora spheciospongiae]|uniref:YrhB domain-containing protein n=1 Tax=Actinokineospora spheciospongiae TaxID=909613 RepID=UPI00137800EC|nr:YrhB domain-containing protein [Actinokineospora spheciospongiae]